MGLCPSAVFHKERQYADEELLFTGHGFGICEAAFEYQPRHPEESILYRKTSFPADRQNCLHSASIGPPIFRHFPCALDLYLIGAYSICQILHRRNS